MIHLSVGPLDDDATLRSAAFGEHAGLWPLPTAVTAGQRWLRAVAAAGQGRYGCAYAALEHLIGDADASASVSSLAHSTRGSLLRQLGWHGVARGYDGRALALAGDDPQAAADALTGLAADALGVGRLAAAATLLDRADPFVAAAPPRVAVRRAWVGAELAMFSGRGTDAVRHAETAIDLAATGGVRHRVKSQVVLAAALCSAGAAERARSVADAALEITAELGLVPLRWALACLAMDLADSADRAGELRSVRDDCAQLIEHRGGVWRSS